MDADGAWTKSNICTRIPGLVGPLLRAARLLYGDGMVSSETSLSMLGVKCGAGIQLVLDRRGGDILLTASKDRTVKLWNPEHGECPRSLAGRQGVVNSAGCLAGRGVSARVQLLLRFESRLFFLAFCFLCSQKRRVQLLLRSKTGESVAFFSWLSVFYTAESVGCNFRSGLRRGKLSRCFVHGFLFYIQPKVAGATFILV